MDKEDQSAICHNPLPLLPWRTVLQNVLLGQELQGEKNKEDSY